VSCIQDMAIHQDWRPLVTAYDDDDDYDDNGDGMDGDGVSS